ncbi:sigma factor [Polymorphospora rubra]|uniref:RNA polymerase sigma24 factor n=1 Tax=Polymorphospora rubra TaxID=338584 RepID=A0A810NAV4_9ACTN|nr:sigma factor [Polymorphospora rubra]BCJ70210.1 RNA polymerase sigma24 factor [Polymorphospora rubra]
MTREGVFEGQRGRLTALAYRMVGSWTDAEDVVQDVAVEWWAGAGDVANPGGWLTKTTVRRAIDALRRRQRESGYVGPWLPEPVVVDRQPAAADLVEARETLSTAFLLIAEALTPPQRAVVVLRSLGYRHDEIAGFLDITPAAARQHHTRATRTLDRQGPPTGTGTAGRDGDDAVTRSLLGAFLSAARDGDLEALVALLHDDVVAYNDGGGRTRAALNPLFGPAKVARFVVGVSGTYARRAVRLVTVNGTPGAIVTLGGTAHVISLQVRDGRIYRIFDVSNPDKHGTVPGPVAPDPAAG